MYIYMLLFIYFSMCANIKSWKPATFRPPNIPKDVGSAILSVNHLTEPSRMLQEFRQATSVEIWLSLERAEHVSAFVSGKDMLKNNLHHMKNMKVGLKKWW